MFNLLKEYWYIIPALLAVLALMYGVFVMIGYGFMWLGSGM